jgi:hypothetical protein
VTAACLLHVGLQFRMIVESLAQSVLPGAAKLGAANPAAAAAAAALSAVTRPPAAAQFGAPPPTYGQVCTHAMQVAPLL